MLALINTNDLNVLKGFYILILAFLGSKANSNESGICANDLENFSKGNESDVG